MTTFVHVTLLPFVDFEKFSLLGSKRNMEKLDSASTIDTNLLETDYFLMFGSFSSCFLHSMFLFSRFGKVKVF